MLLRFFIKVPNTSALFKLRLGAKHAQDSTWSGDRSHMTGFNGLNHGSLVTPYGFKNLGQHKFSKWLVAWRHQVINWTNIDFLRCEVLSYWPGSNFTASAQATMLYNEWKLYFWFYCLIFMGQSFVWYIQLSIYHGHVSCHIFTVDAPPQLEYTPSCYTWPLCTDNLLYGYPCSSHIWYTKLFQCKTVHILQHCIYTQQLPHIECSTIIIYFGSHNVAGRVRR